MSKMNYTHIKRAGHYTTFLFPVSSITASNKVYFVLASSLPVLILKFIYINHRNGNAAETHNTFKSSLISTVNCTVNYIDKIVRH
jgi:hypothetical protein